MATAFEALISLLAHLADARRGPRAYWIGSLLFIIAAVAVGIAFAQLGEGF